MFRSSKCGLNESGVPYQKVGAKKVRSCAFSSFFFTTDIISYSSIIFEDRFYLSENIACRSAFLNRRFEENASNLGLFLKYEERGELLSEVVKCAELYEKYLNDKNLMFVFQKRADNKLSFIESRSQAHNFLHLTGVVYNGKSAVQFYKECINHKINSQCPTVEHWLFLYNENHAIVAWLKKG